MSSELRVNKQSNRVGLGTVEYTNTGIIVSGIVTATSFKGDGSALTGIDATKIITGNTQVQTIDTGSDGHVKVLTEGSERVRIDSSGLFGVGTSTLEQRLNIHEADSDGCFLKVTNSTTGTGNNDGALFGITDAEAAVIWQRENNIIQLATNNAERLRIDSSGRLLLGTTTNSSPIGWNNNLQVAGTNAQAGISIRRDENGTGGALLIFGKSRGSLNGNTAVQSGDQIGGMYFAGADGTDVNSIAAQISVEVDGTPGGNDMPGRLIFKTTADNAASPTERLRIDKNGDMCLGGTPFSQGTGNTFCIHSSGTGGGDHAYIYFTNGDSGHTASDGMSIGLAANQVANIAVREAWPFAISTNGSERLRIESTGHVLPGADNTQDLGSSSKRWANIHTGDLHLSNTGSVNSVDGTSGSWTMQEGSDDLFLINNKTGKKYKFHLMEVN